MKFIENSIADPGAIVEMAERYTHLFMDYPEIEPSQLFDPYRETFDQSDDRMHVLRMGYNMPDDLAAVVIDALGMSSRDRDSDIRIHRYDHGDYMQPRRHAGPTEVYMLTTSDHDGMTIGDGDDGFIKINDQAGAHILADAGAWHWVDPVRAQVRFTLAADPPVRGRPPIKQGNRRHSQADRRGKSDRRGGVVQLPPKTTEVIGEGANSIVYGTAKEGRVLKTCWRTRPYSLFLNFVSRLNSRHLPVIFREANNVDGRQWVEMERLQLLPSSDRRWDKINAFAIYCHAIADRRPISVPEELTPELQALAVKLGKYARQHGVSLDLSPANIMIRETTGEIVFVDPLW